MRSDMEDFVSPIVKFKRRIYTPIGKLTNHKFRFRPPENFQSDKITNKSFLLTQQYKFVKDSFETMFSNEKIKDLIKTQGNSFMKTENIKDPRTQSFMDIDNSHIKSKLSTFHINSDDKAKKANCLKFFNRLINDQFYKRENIHPIPRVNPLPFMKFIPKTKHNIRQKPIIGMKKIRLSLNESYKSSLPKKNFSNLKDSLNISGILIPNGHTKAQTLVAICGNYANRSKSQNCTINEIGINQTDTQWYNQKIELRNIAKQKATLELTTKKKLIDFPLMFNNNRIRKPRRVHK